MNSAVDLGPLSFAQEYQTPGENVAVPIQNDDTPQQGTATSHADVENASFDDKQNPGGDNMNEEGIHSPQTPSPVQERQNAVQR